MTRLSVNINKIALLRNSRGRDFPNVIDFAKKFIELGAHGITVHPRQDERHITVNDVYVLAEFLQDYRDIEYNIEGYPTDDFIKIIVQTKPDQCTLVPDGVNQVTSDHGWNVFKHKKILSKLAQQLKDMGVRSAVFLDPDIEQINQVAQTQVDRIELYTEEYALNHVGTQRQHVFNKYSQAAKQAQNLGLGVNAGHDLDANNLAEFLTINDILEVSIGHVLTIECIQFGMPVVVKKYLDICNHTNAQIS